LPFTIIKDFLSNLSSKSNFNLKNMQGLFFLFLRTFHQRKKLLFIFFRTFLQTACPLPFLTFQYCTRNALRKLTQQKFLYHLTETKKNVMVKSENPITKCVLKRLKKEFILKLMVYFWVKRALYNLNFSINSNDIFS